MSDIDRLTVRFSPDQLSKLGKKSDEVGMEKVELVRLAVASFLAKEDALSEYLSAIDKLESQLVRMEKRQELFTRTLGNCAQLKDSEKTPEIRQKMVDRINQIIDTVGVENGD